MSGQNSLFGKFVIHLGSAHRVDGRDVLVDALTLRITLVFTILFSQWLGNLGPRCHSLRLWWLHLSHALGQFEVLLETYGLLSCLVHHGNTLQWLSARLYFG